MTIYRGFGGTNREVKQQFRGLGGVNREIKEVYRGVSGVNRKVFQAGPSIIDINDGQFLNHTKTLLAPAETVDGASQGFKIIGRASVPYFDVTYGDMLRWEMNIDFTSYASLTLYAKKVVDHGSLLVAIDCPTNKKWDGDEMLPYIVLDRFYRDLPTDWTKYTISTTSLTGVHKLGIAGGFFDISGSVSSETQICKIELL